MAPSDWSIVEAVDKRPGSNWLMRVYRHQKMHPDDEARIKKYLIVG